MAIQSTAKPRARVMRRTIRTLWVERVMAIAVLTNLGLVAFDASYIPWRDFYLKKVPTLTQWYGAQFKGIEPHRSTETYLATVEELKHQVSLSGLRSPEAAQLLENLRAQSVELIDENPFQSANKSGTLERIKNRIRSQVNQKSSKQAFERFWSVGYLEQTGWVTATQFFDRQLRPLLASNYFRGIGENGEPIDRFWLLDGGFIALFGLEFLARTLSLCRRDRVNWLDAIIWRSYDLPLLLPVWRWLRLIPLAVRLEQAKLVRFQPLSDRLTRWFITSIAAELTEVVVLRMIDQTQELLRQGDLVRWLLNSEGGQRYIDLNDINEGEAIAQRVIHLLVYQVLPKLKPEIELLLHHVLTQALNLSPAYAGLQRLPGVGGLSDQITKQLVTDLSHQSYQAILDALADEVGVAMVQRLVDKLGSALRSEAKQSQALNEIQALIVDLLDEVKINYVKRVAAEDIEQIKANHKRLYGLTQSGR